VLATCFGQYVRPSGSSEVYNKDMCQIKAPHTHLVMPSMITIVCAYLRTVHICLV